MIPTLGDAVDGDGRHDSPSLSIIKADANTGRSAMAFSTILSPTVLSSSGQVFDWPNITTLSDGSFALTFLDFATTNSVITYVYSAQGAFLGGGPAMPEQSPQSEFDGNLAALAGGGYALAWTEFVMVGNFFE